jgi:hypothetical protein
MFHLHRQAKETADMIVRQVTRAVLVAFAALTLSGFFIAPYGYPYRYHPHYYGY